MKILALFILLLFVINPHAKSQTADFAKLIRPFLKASQGYYEQRLTGAEFSERERQPQDFLFYPIHKGKDSQWFHLVWLMPSDKIRPLDQILMCFNPHNADSAKISFYDVAEPEKYSKEWAKKIAFADLAFDELQSTLPLMTGFLLLKKQKAGFFRWYTSQPLPRRSKGAIYNSVKMEFHFYGDKVSSAIDFYKDNQFLMSQAHHILVAKTSSNFKKY